MPASDLIPAIAAFARVAHHASFTRAADELGVSASALSQTVRSLEKRLDVRLLDRSTRRVGLTEIGQRFLAEAAPGLATVHGAIDGLNESRERPAGLLRLNLSRSAADVVVMPHLAAFLATYPDIGVEMNCDNALLDLVSGGFDAGIRIGENLAQDVVALPLGGPLTIATVAAPSYLKGRPLPRKPEDLHAHRCLNVRLPTGIYRWEFVNKGRRVAFEAAGPLISNDGDVVLNAARSGVGIACAVASLVQHDLASGRLVPVLKPWWPSYTGFHLYHPSRLRMPRKLRVFIDYLRERMPA